MQYIYFKHIKTDEDKKRVKNHPKMTNKELEKILDGNKEIKIITEDIQEKSKIVALENRKLIFKEISKTLTQKKHYLSGFIKKNHFAQKKLPIEFKDGNQTFLLNSLEATATDLFYIKRIRENKINNIKLYDDLYKRIKAILEKNPGNDDGKFLKFPKTITIETKAIPKWLKDLAIFGFKLLYPVSLISTTYDPTSPGPEEGEGDKTDQHIEQECADSNPTKNPKGFLQNIDWPLKPHLTSVKNQGKRNTCTAFGTCGAIETKISEKYGQKVNLSEQDLYKKQKIDWNPNVFEDDYEDGNSATFGLLYQAVRGHIFSPESAWQYNPSLLREPDPEQRTYTHSCDNYTGICSDTSHQAVKRCYTMDVTDTIKVVKNICAPFSTAGFGLLLNTFNLVEWVCHKVEEWTEEIVGQVEVCLYEPDIVNKRGFKLTDISFVWDPIWDNDVTLAKLQLNDCKPLIAAFNVPRSFKKELYSTADGKGFIVFDANEEPPENPGQHTVELVGYVDNDMIPANLSVTPGDGGGYFIIKNSHGTCWGDMGYGYLPYSWWMKWGVGMLSVNNVEQVL